MKLALAAGTAVSLAVTAAWSFSAALASGPAPVPRMTGNLVADYASLAAAPTGNGLLLLAVLAVTYAACIAAALLKAGGR